MAQVNYEDGGLVFIKKVTGSAVSEIIVDNCFSADYSQYKLIGAVAGSTTSQPIHLRYRAGGVTESSNVYTYQYIIGSTTVILGNRSTTTEVLYAFGTAETGVESMSITEVLNPFQSTYTTSFSMFPQTYTGTINCDLFTQGTTTTTSFDGISVFAGSGTITGTVYVYGYKES